MRVRRNALALLAVALLSAACGGSSGGSVAAAPKDNGTAGGSAGSTVEMATNNYSFSPAEVHGTPGQRVTIHLTNSSGTEHNFTLEDQKIDKDIESGEDADVTVTVPASGQLVFVCEYHASKGMKGTVVAGSGAASPAASSSSDNGAGSLPGY